MNTQKTTQKFKLFLGVLLLISCLALDASARTRKKVKKVEKKQTEQVDSQKFDGQKLLGVGGFIGTEMGVIGKYWFGSGSPFGVQAALGYDFSDDIMLFSEGLYHFKNLTEVRIQKPVTIDGYAGAGVKVIFDEPQVIFRLPVGSDFEIQDSAVDGFLQLVPGIELSPKTAGKLEIEIGARYIF